MLRVRTFICTRCGRKFMKNVGGVVLSEREIALIAKPICDSCKAEQAINGVAKAVNALKEIIQRKHE